MAREEREREREREREEEEPERQGREGNHIEWLLSCLSVPSCDTDVFPLCATPPAADVFASLRRA